MDISIVTIITMAIDEDLKYTTGVFWECEISLW